MPAYPLISNDRTRVHEAGRATGRGLPINIIIIGVGPKDYPLTLRTSQSLYDRCVAGR